jgi:maleate cis-trans isomerase
MRRNFVGRITLGTQRGYQIEQEVVGKLSRRVRLSLSTGMNASVDVSTESIAIAMAYMEKINQAVKRYYYYEDAGLRVLGITGLEVTKPVEQVKLSHYASYKYGSYKVARTLYKQNPGADAIFKDTGA